MHPIRIPFRQHTLLARRVHYSASITRASPRWLFCEPRATPHNLSVCDSKQTVAAVWRPRPSRDTARFTQPGRLGCRRGHPALQCRMSGRVDGTGATLGETFVRLGSPDASSRWCTASRHPPSKPDAAVHRAAAVPPIRGPGWHYPRRANRVLIFLITNWTREGEAPAAPTGGSIGVPCPRLGVGMYRSKGVATESGGSAGASPVRIRLTQSSFASTTNPPAAATTASIQTGGAPVLAPPILLAVLRTRVRSSQRASAG
jgi:hypothetical protein